MDRRDTHEQRSPHRKPAAEARQPPADSRGAGALARDRRELGVGCQRAPQMRRHRAVDRELGRAFEQVDHQARQRRPRRSLAGLAARGQEPGQPRHERRCDQQRSQQDQRCRRQHQPNHRDRRRADSERDRELGEHPQQQILQGVDVFDQARQQVAACERRQAEGGELLESPIDGNPQIRQHAERGVVTDEPLCVAAQAARQREELHADDRDRHSRLLRVLGRARDQPGRGGDQADRG